LSVYKEDLIQFKDIVAKDTKKIIDENKEFLEKEGAAGIKNKLTEGVSNGINIITESIANFDITKITNFTSTQDLETDLDKRIKQLQQDPNTFTEPEDQEFLNWQSTFDLNQHKSEIEAILSTNSEIFLIYSRLVPESISPQDFWERYYYRLKLQKEDEERKIALLKAPEVTQLTWDDSFEEDKSTDQQPQVLEPQPEAEVSTAISTTTSEISEPLPNPEIIPVVTTETVPTPVDTSMVTPTVSNQNAEKSDKGEDWKEILDW